MSGWNFPGNGNGQIRGFSDAGIETFNGDEIQALARETCQNSLDALKDGKSEIKVDFFRYKINSNCIPGYSEYKEAIEKCKDYWKQSNSAKANSFLDEALKAIKRNESYVLRVSDYNTKGLLGAYDDRFDGWNALTKIDGGATKNGDTAGSFGIGKNAPFCNSFYRLVFYRTLNEENIIAAQGVSRLLSFPKDINEVMDTMTTGIGYFGNREKNRPVNNIPELDELCKRNEIGTDVFVYGFNNLSGHAWIEEMCIEIMDNFLMSIFTNKLAINIQDEELNKKTLNRYIINYKTKLKNTYCNYLVLTRNDDVKKYELDFHGMGVLKLSVLVDPDEKLNKKILVTRKSGMKLFHLGNISRAITFSGILELEGEKLNEYFREMETPSHDSWKPTRHSNPQQAKIYYDELKDWVRDIVLQLGEYTSDEEIEIEGLGSILQNELAIASKQNEDDKVESLNNNLGEIILSSRKREQITKGLFFGGSGTNDSLKNDVSGRVTLDGDKSTVRSLGGIRTRSKKDIHKGVEDQSGRDKVHSPIGGGVDCPLKDARVIKIDSGKYKMSFGLPRNISAGHIELVTIGENGRSSRLKISSAIGINGCTGINVSQQRIEFSNMSAEMKVKIDFALMDSRDYAMEVNVYEHNK